MKKYDFLIVGSGLYGSTLAYELTRKGYDCYVIDRRNHIGGNIYTKNIEDINIHMYGAHIFHTSDRDIWEYINKFAEFNRFTNSPLASFRGKYFNLPFNMNTFYQLWGVKTPEEASKKIQAQIIQANIKEINNLRDQAICMVGSDVYETLVKDYTEKQWGQKCETLPPSIIKRLPIRYTYDNNYFDDLYQGIPIGGYTQIIERMLQDCEIKLNYDFFDHEENCRMCADIIIYTGMIDQYFQYCYGALDYRSLRFEHEIFDISNYQGNAVINYIDCEIPYTRCIEHKHFEFGNQAKTVITKEYPSAWRQGDEPYYPINDDKNTDLFQRYQQLARQEKNVFFGGRLGQYQYYDMHQVIQTALNQIPDLLKAKESL